jgi:hypothetical protein
MKNTAIMAQLLQRCDDPPAQRLAPMFNSPLAARAVSGKLALIFTLLLSSATAVHAQCAPLQADPAKLASQGAPHGPLLPESAYLSKTTYTNIFFGFALDLPIAVQGHMVKLPLMPQRQHALLAIAFQDGDRSGSLTIDAIEPKEGLQGPSAKQQRQQINPGPPGSIQTGTQTDSQIQPQIGPNGTLQAPRPQMGMPEFQLPEERFHSNMRHSGDKYTALYWTRIKDYRVGVMVATDDKDFLERSKRAMAAIRFYCTADDGTLATREGKLVIPEGEPYEGPTVPTWRADAAIQKSTGLEIPPGEISQGAYRNAALGLQYELPQGWEVLSAHNGGNPPADLADLREYQLLLACSRTLLRIEQPGSSETAGRGPGPMIILRALDPACLSLRTPAAVSDQKIAEEVGVSLEALGDFGQVSSHDLVSTSNRLVMVFHGTIEGPTEGERLATRMSQTMIATSQNKMLLVWSFLTPTAGQLATMPAGGISFDGSQALELQPVLAGKR